MKVREMIGLGAMMFTMLGSQPASAIETSALAGTWHTFIEYRQVKADGEIVIDYSDGHVVILGDGSFNTCDDSNLMIESSWIVLHKKSTTLDPTGCAENFENTPGFWLVSGFVEGGVDNKFGCGGPRPIEDNDCGLLTIDDARGIRTDYTIIRGTVSPGGGTAEMVIDGVIANNGVRVHGLVRLTRRWPAKVDAVPAAPPFVYQWDQWTRWEDTGVDRYAVMPLNSFDRDVITRGEARCNGQFCLLFHPDELRQVCNVSLTGLVYGCRVRL